MTECIQKMLSFRKPIFFPKTNEKIGFFGARNLVIRINNVVLASAQSRLGLCNARCSWTQDFNGTRQGCDSNLRIPNTLPGRMTPIRIKMAKNRSFMAL